MRSTFGTMVYKEERDIKQVANVLGHSNISTSQTYYSASDDEIKRQAFRSVRLRGKEKLMGRNLKSEFLRQYTRQFRDT